MGGVATQRINILWKHQLGNPTASLVCNDSYSGHSGTCAVFGLEIPDTNPIDLETDARFPSGRWTGFFLQVQVPGKHQMELLLTFRQGSMTGEGRDWVGEFMG